MFSFRARYSKERFKRPAAATKTDYSDTIFFTKYNLSVSCEDTSVIYQKSEYLHWICVPSHMGRMFIAVKGRLKTRLKKRELAHFPGAQYSTNPKWPLSESFSPLPVQHKARCGPARFVVAYSALLPLRTPRPATKSGVSLRGSKVMTQSLSVRHTSQVTDRVDSTPVTSLVMSLENKSSRQEEANPIVQKHRYEKLLFSYWSRPTLSCEYYWRSEYDP